MNGIGTAKEEVPSVDMNTIQNNVAGEMGRMTHDELVSFFVFVRNHSWRVLQARRDEANSKHEGYAKERDDLDDKIAFIQQEYVKDDTHVN